MSDIYEYIKKYNTANENSDGLQAYHLKSAIASDKDFAGKVINYFVGVFDNEYPDLDRTDFDSVIPSLQKFYAKKVLNNRFFLFSTGTDDKKRFEIIAGIRDRIAAEVGVKFLSKDEIDEALNSVDIDLDVYFKTRFCFYYLNGIPPVDILGTKISLEEIKSWYKNSEYLLPDRTSLGEESFGGKKISWLYITA